MNNLLKYDKGIILGQQGGFHRKSMGEVLLEEKLYGINREEPVVRVKDGGLSCIH